jgi:hypothetical protein
MARGRKTGGRKKGTRNRRTIAQREIIASGMSPLEFLCSVYRDPKQSMARRIESAKCAAPYFHPKLTAVGYTPPPAQDEDNVIQLVFVNPAGEREIELARTQTIKEASITEG